MALTQKNVQDVIDGKTNPTQELEFLVDNLKDIRGVLDSMGYYGKRGEIVERALSDSLGFSNKADELRKKINDGIIIIDEGSLPGEKKSKYLNAYEDLKLPQKISELASRLDQINAYLESDGYFDPDIPQVESDKLENVEKPEITKKLQFLGDVIYATANLSEQLDRFYKNATHVVSKAKQVFDKGVDFIKTLKEMRSEATYFKNTEYKEEAENLKKFSNYHIKNVSEKMTEINKSDLDVDRRKLANELFCDGQLAKSEDTTNITLSGQAYANTLQELKANAILESQEQKEERV